MARQLDRIFRPKSLAVIGGGPWGEAIIQQAQKFGFVGEIWPIHPSRETVAGLPAFQSVRALPSPPDSAFIGINRDATIGAVERLRKIGAGGAVCFASGFTEAQAEDPLAADAQSRLRKAAGEMPILGPNCYGFINALDGAVVWPDQHGMARVEKGVAILTQSSNIAINLSFQKRALPIAMMITCGNMAQLSQAAMIDALLDDPRITAIGLHIEGFADLPGWEAAAQKADAKNIPIIALKAGRSDAARLATQSHTASLAGEDAGAAALMSFLGIGRVETLSELLEALKLGHVCGRLPSRNIASISCSGGEASLAADLGEARGITFPPLTDQQTTKLRDVLGPKVALANPLDYHTYIWRDTAAMTAAWAAIAGKDTAITLSIVDIPDADRADPKDWACAVDAAVGAHKATGAPFALVSSLPETMPMQTAANLMAQGIAPLQGLSDAMAAVAALEMRKPQSDLVTATVYDVIQDHDESAAKAALGKLPISIPKHTDQLSRLTDLQFPVAVKATGIAHKTEANAVTLNIQTPQEAATIMDQYPAGACFAEEMVQGGIVELLVAFTNDQAHGIMLTLGAGGTLTELWQDTQHLMLPVDADQIETALSKLRIAPILDGYRGKPAVSRDTLVRAVLTLQTFVISQQDGFVELEINPLICTQDDAIVADALWRQSTPEIQ